MPTSTLSPSTETEKIIDKNVELIEEIKKLTHQLEIQNHPYKRIGKAFTTGVFTALGSVFGTVVVISLLVYILSQLSFTKGIIEFFKNGPKPGSLTPKIELFVPELSQP